jgi:CRISPR-associated protein Cst2
MTIKSILVASVAVMDMHRANSGQNQLGNATAIKRRPDGRVYISGQMQRHAFFSALDRLNDGHTLDGGPAAGRATYVSTGDGTSFQVETDLRADLGGFLLTAVNGEAGRRTSPVSATPAVALEASHTVRDMLLRLSTQDDNQNIATMEMSQSDRMAAAFSLDCAALSTSKRHTFEAKATDKGLHVDTTVVQHATDAERLRRAALFLEATRYVTDYASQARNATTGEPQQVLIVLDPVHARKAARYFRAPEAEQANLLAELDARGARYFEGDDRTAEGRSVHEAYAEALDTLRTHGITGGGHETMTYAETFEAMADFRETT